MGGIVSHIHFPRRKNVLFPYSEPVVLFVYYDYKVNYEESELGKDQIQIVAAKVRYGENRKLLFGFNGDRVLFHENIKNEVDVVIAKDEEEIKDMLQRVKQIDFTSNIK